MEIGATPPLAVAGCFVRHTTGQSRPGPGPHRTRQASCVASRRAGSHKIREASSVASGRDSHRTSFDVVHTRRVKGFFTLGDAWSFPGLTSKISPVGSTSKLTLTSKRRPRIANVKTPSSVTTALRHCVGQGGCTLGASSVSPASRWSTPDASKVTSLCRGGRIKGNSTIALLVRSVTRGQRILSEAGQTLGI